MRQLQVVIALSQILVFLHPVLPLRLQLLVLLLELHHLFPSVLGKTILNRYKEVFPLGNGSYKRLKSQLVGLLHYENQLYVIPFIGFEGEVEYKHKELSEIIRVPLECVRLPLDVLLIDFLIVILDGVFQLGKVLIAPSIKHGLEGAMVDVQQQLPNNGYGIVFVLMDDLLGQQDQGGVQFFALGHLLSYYSMQIQTFVSLQIGQERRGITLIITNGGIVREAYCQVVFDVEMLLFVFMGQQWAQSCFIQLISIILNMIYDHFTHQDDNPFRRTEILEQLRQQLSILASKDHESLNLIIKDPQQSPKTQQQYNQGKSLEKTDKLISEVQYQLKNRSQNIQILVNLIFKLIDFIQEQQQRMMLISMRYGGQVQQVRSQNDILRERNLVIQNQMQYFKQHIDIVQHQLEKLTEKNIHIEYENKDRTLPLSEDEHNIYLQTLSPSEGNHHHHMLQKTNIHSQTHLFKYSGLHMSNSQPFLMKSLKESPFDYQRELLQYQRQIDYLVSQNNSLKKQLELRSKLIDNLQISIDREVEWNRNQERQEEEGSYNMNNMMKKNDKDKMSMQIIQRIASSKSIRDFLQPISHKIMPFNTADNRYIEFGSPLEYVKPNTLSHQYSQKSFQFTNYVSSSNLFRNSQNRHEEEDQVKLFQKDSRIYDHANTEEKQADKNGQENKQTEQSVRAIVFQNAQLNKRQYADVGVNTQGITDYMGQIMDSSTKIQEFVTATCIEQNKNAHQKDDQQLNEAETSIISKDMAQNAHKRFKPLLAFKNYIVGYLFLLFSYIWLRRKQQKECVMARQQVEISKDA